MRFAVNPFFLLYFSSNLSSKVLYRLQDCLLGLSDLRSSSRLSNNDYHPVFNAWKASRLTTGRDASLLSPGTQRPLSLANARLALFVCQECAMDFVSPDFTAILTPMFNPHRSGLFGLSTLSEPLQCCLSTSLEVFFQHLEVILRYATFLSTNVAHR
jgi:hypothetical protein